MTEQEKDILIGKMLDSPSSLTDEELDIILTDDELRDIYEISAAVSGAYIDQRDYDMADEWVLFRSNIRRRPMPMRWVMRIAAIFLGVVFVGGVTVRIIDRKFDAPRQSIAKVQDIKSPSGITPIEDDIKSEEIPKKEDSRSLIRRNNTASSCRYASNTKITKTGQMETQEENIDIDEYLRIQQARIDNDLAMMEAESYLYEYNEFLQNLDDIDSYDTTELDDAIRQVTMQ